jgi:arabinan endo-1,5-alpha-L-arabinosidase
MNRAQSAPLRILAALLLSSAVYVSGCSSGGSSPSPAPTPAPTTPDLGTLASVSDNFQFKIKNVSNGELLGIAGQSQMAGARMDNASDTGTGDQLWHFIPIGNNEFNIENLLTHQMAGIAAASAASGALGLQYADNGTNDHLWAFYLLTDGNYLIKNVNSSLYLQLDTTMAPAAIDQAARATTGTGCTCQEWTLTSTGVSAYPAPLTVSGSGIYVHDPNMIQDASGVFWLYGTHNTLASSSDMTKFTAVTAGDINPDFSWWASENTTGTNGRTDSWASSVMFANKIYYQYYKTSSELPLNRGPAE